MLEDKSIDLSLDLNFPQLLLIPDLPSKKPYMIQELLWRIQRGRIQILS